MWEVVSGPGRNPAPFLAAVAGATVTLVAIVGGLIAARLVAVASARAAAGERRAAAERKLSQARETLQRLEKAHKDFDELQVASQVLDRLVEERGQEVSAELLLETCDLPSIEQDFAIEAIRSTQELVKEAFATLMQCANSAGLSTDWPPTWVDARYRLRPPIGSDRRKLMVYERVYYKLRADARTNTQLSAPHAGTQSLPPGAFTSFGRPHLRNNLKAWDFTAAQSLYLALGEAKATVRHREAEVDAASAVVGRVSSSRTRGPLIVLGLLSAGILVPALALLAAEPTALGWVWRVFLAAGFSLGVLALVLLFIIGALPEPWYRPWDWRKDRSSPQSGSVNRVNP